MRDVEMRVVPLSPGPWAVVLAGGDGTRLRPLVDRLYDDRRPKQFASLVEPRSLLRATLDRVARFAPAHRTVVLTLERHRALVAAELGNTDYWILEQPLNRGTATAILWAAMQIERREPGASVAIVPSDHHLVDDRDIGDQILALSALTRSDPGRIFLLAAQPTRAEPGYGWIEPGRLIGIAAGRPVRAVERFVEKPSEAAAQAMLQRDWLWSTLLTVGRAGTLAGLGRDHLPWLQQPLERVIRDSEQGGSQAALHRAFAQIRGGDFSRDLLERVPARLGVSVLSDREWTDLGTPERVLNVVRASGRMPAWPAIGEVAAGDS